MIVLLILSSLSGWIVTFAALLSFGPGTAISGATLGANLFVVLLLTVVLFRSRRGNEAEPASPARLETAPRNNR
jgi:hypothetical protein